MKLHHRQDPRIDPDGIIRRFVEFRYDGDRKISGVALRYGDVAELPWGDKERFEQGAFGSTVGSEDIILNLQHDRMQPLARTGGGGLAIMDDPDALRLEATLPETTAGNDTLELVRNKVLRGFSVEFVPEDWRIEEENVMVIERAELRGIGVVDRPAYEKSKINPRHKQKELDMTEEQIRALIEEALKNRTDDSTVDAVALARSIAGGLEISIAETVQEKVKAEVEAALETAQQAEEERAKAEADKKAAEEKAETERAAIEAEASERADLTIQFRDLLPEDFDYKGKDKKAILVAAVGDEVEEADKRSEDYLLAKAEIILERRNLAAQQQQAAGQRELNPNNIEAVGNGGVPILSLINNREQARMAQGG